jgi:hypothetical protein
MVVSLVWRVVQGLLYEYPPATGGINQKLPKALAGDAAAPCMTTHSSIANHSRIHPSNKMVNSQVSDAFSARSSAVMRATEGGPEAPDYDTISGNNGYS